MTFDVRTFGAKGDGRALDSDAINAAIAAASTAGGGTVSLPAGRYLSFSIRLASSVTLRLEEGCVLVAADPALHGGSYDPPEENPHDLYQDFGHSHWRNSLIWGEDLEDVAIEGPGRIDGEGLTREGPGSRWRRQAGEFPLSMVGLSAEAMAELVPERAAMIGQGNKAIGLKRCRGVRLSGFSLVRGGHFAVLATGCEDLVIENLLVDTNRDGLDIDGCSRVRISGCRINTPNDDAIVLKASMALGRALPTQDVEIAGCHVSGFDPGTVSVGAPGREQQISPDQDRVTGRIKIGTESNGDFRRIRIRDCVLERSRGLALETVDGGTIEDVEIENVRLVEMTSAPLFLRLGARLRGPEGTGPGALRRVIVRNLRGEDAWADLPVILAGLPGRPIEDVRLETLSLSFLGGAGEAGVEPPELEDAYPEPRMFGDPPAWGLWARHVRGLTIEGLALSGNPDARAPIRIDGEDVAPERFSNR
ncbi:exo-poly-alpha-D-galacturonosidase [Caulobacter flavus]|uniref:Exo-poly-alpha-D-galacturonosidase n=1 Tax=Caulobacter flavus TaxID=1679497 RepID=A0A2N5CXK1_9CAUL|nr:glycosyl hydrolase family 28-related protein [Caulobacter flavus]AYV47301.1 exo-poly-alpha-D-galacturonosidase [Caulobacter flavus]PLR18538.1 exo-poly-alpha-D-galacturonosidase [Caulobacter flavus]